MSNGSDSTSNDSNSSENSSSHSSISDSSSQRSSDSKKEDSSGRVVSSNQNDKEEDDSSSRDTDRSDGSQSNDRDTDRSDGSQSNDRDGDDRYGGRGQNSPQSGSRNGSEHTEETDDLSHEREAGEHDSNDPYDRLGKHKQERASERTPDSEEPGRKPSEHSASESGSSPQNLKSSDTDNQDRSTELAKKDSKSKETESPDSKPGEKVDRRSRIPKSSAGGKIAAVAATGASGVRSTANRAKEEMQGGFGEEEETDDKPKKDNKGGGIGGVAKKAGTAVLAKGATALKALLLSPKGLIVMLIALLIPVVIIIAIVVTDTIDRTLSHTKKYGCVEDKFTMDFLDLLSPGNGKTIADSIGDLFSDTETSCKDGSGWTGEFYPPTVGNVTQTWFYTSGMYHGATDIANGREGPEAPIFAYAGGEVIARVDGTANAAGWPANARCSRDFFSSWEHARTVQGDILISHQPGLLESRYSHMWKKDMYVRVGDVVSAGDEIGGQGNSGWSCGTHLHFEVHESGEQVDPIPHMKERGIEFPYTLDTLPEKPEGDADGGSGENSENVPTKLMQHAVSAMKSAGISTSKSEQTCLAKLWNRESNWRVDAINPQFAPGAANIPENQAYGIPQSGPGIKMASEGSDWKTNPKTQIRWGIKYIKGRYGTPCKAWAHSEDVNWY